MTDDTKTEVPEERWGVWITQAEPRKGQTKPDSYWWQGPDYKGDHMVTKPQAEATARALQEACRPWTYVAKPYDKAPVCRVHDPDDAVPGRICGRPMPCREHG